MSDYVDAWRRRKSRAFDLEENSTAKATLPLSLWGRSVEIYANANFSIYSGQICNAKCPFCVEELRPASRGRALVMDRTVEPCEGRYLAALEACLEALRPLSPTISITGGEPSKDPRLPAILRRQARFASKRRSLTTNGSGLLDRRGRKRVIDHVLEAGIDHLNVSRAAADHDRNARLMVLGEGLSLAELREVARLCRGGPGHGEPSDRDPGNQNPGNCTPGHRELGHRELGHCELGHYEVGRGGGTRLRLSCVLLSGETDSLEGVVRYLRFAASLGVDNVIFRQLMHVDRLRVADNFVVRYSDRRRAQLEPILDAMGDDPRFFFQKQIVGYYYYVEVWRFEGIDVVFEEADLGQLEVTKGTMPGIIHELVFHPNAKLCTTWQPWDGELGPPDEDAPAASLPG